MKIINKLAGVFLLVLIFSWSTDVYASSSDTLKTNHPMSFFNNKAIEGSSTAKVLSLDKGKSVTFVNPYSTTGATMTVYAGTFNGTFDLNSAKFYCIDIAHYLAFWSTSQPHTYTDSGATPSPITYILNKYFPYKPYPYPGSLGSNNEEAAAVQLAIWHFSDGVVVNTITNSTIRNRVAAIVADANLNGNNMVVASAISIIPGSQNLVIGTPASFFAKIVDGQGNGISGLTVNFATNSGTLSSSSAVTGSLGSTPNITLTMGTAYTAEITASAVFTIPHGTRFVHSVTPNDYQKLVLATPVLANRVAKAYISWYTPNNGCDLTGYTTYTQGGWGSPGNSTPGSVRDQYFNQVFPSGMVIGTGFTITFTSATAVKNFLPAGGTAGALTQNYTNPTTTSAGVLAGQVAAMKLNVAFNDAGVLGTNPTKVGNLIINSGPFSGKTVYELLQIANTALGGGTTPYTFSEINSAVTSFNENFDNGTSNHGFLTCNNNNSRADISIQKTTSKTNPVVGDEVTFTITVSNSGPGAATNVKVKDILPSGFQYLNSTASQGTYNQATGIWNVGTINAGANAVLTIVTKVNVVLINNGYFSLGPAVDFNVFILEDITQPSSDTQGKMAVGRNATLSHYSIGDQLPIVDSVDVLIVGNNLQFESGAVYGGNVVYGNSTNLPKLSVSIVDGILRQDQVINFTNAANYLQNLSLQLAGYTVNGTTTFAFSNLVLTGTSPFLNVFSVPDTFINNATSVEINAPNGSVVVVNFRGANIRWGGGLVVNGTDMTNVLYNFPDAANLQISGIDVRGSVLAPFAHVNFVAGVQHGQMIARSLCGAGQFNLANFIGYVPIEESITNIAEVISLDQLDPDSSPGNGVTTEDDYSSVTMIVSGVNSVGGGGGGGSTNWTPVGQFASGELVWTLGYDGLGNMLAGTFGGKIYKSTDNGTTWVRINSAMNTNYIWSIKTKASNGYIFVGTEDGVYRSTNNGIDWTLIGPVDNDVRALAIDASGAVYAGTWGSGIYKSTNNGTSWVQINTGLNSNAVHALAINSAGEIFAGTYGTGMYKSTNHGASWVNLNMGYDFVWTLGITSDGTILAGTYGKGVYRSTNNGATWSIINNGLRGRFMYSIVIDGNNNAFVATWAGGVYVSTNNGESWYTIGLNGANVSSLIIAASGNKGASSSPVLYAGTSAGVIYKNENPLSNVKQVNTMIPEEFGLMQNYPNPFNPSTNIIFDVPFESKVTLKVFNVLGEEIRTLINSKYGAGRYNVEFDARSLPSGVYIYRLTAGNVSITKKMLLQK